MSQIKNRQKTGTIATKPIKKTKIKKQRVKSERKAFKKLKRRSIKLQIRRFNEIVPKDFKFDAILSEVIKDAIEDVANILFDDLGKVGKKVFYCVHKNLKSRIEEHNRWQKKKKKKKKKRRTNKQKKRRRKRTKGKGLFPNRYFQTSLWR